MPNSTSVQGTMQIFATEYVQRGSSGGGGGGEDCNETGSRLCYKVHSVEKN